MSYDDQLVSQTPVGQQTVKQFRRRYESFLPRISFFLCFQGPKKCLANTPPRWFRKVSGKQSLAVWVLDPVDRKRSFLYSKQLSINQLLQAFYFIRMAYQIQEKSIRKILQPPSMICILNLCMNSLHFHVVCSNFARGGTAIYGLYRYVPL